MIVVKNLHKSFDKLEVLKGIDCHIHQKEVVCVIGPSGSGKSTFLRCINRLEEAQQGQIFIDGEEVTAPNADINRIRQEMGMVFSYLTSFPIRPLGKCNSGSYKNKENEQRRGRRYCYRFVEESRVRDKDHVYPSQLSGGKNSELP